MKDIKRLILFLPLFVVFSLTAQNRTDRIIHEFKNSKSSNVLVAAHRGDWRHAPENSIKAIKNCIKMDVDIVEIDVRKTKDGRLVLMHDETVDRTTNGTGKVSEMTLAELKQLYLKNNQGGKDAELTNERIPTLEEAMMEAKGKILVNLDKSYGIMKDVYPVLEKTGTLGIVILKGTYPPEQVKKDLAFMDEPVFFMPIVRDSEDVHEKIKSYIRTLHPVAFEIILGKDDSVLDESDYIKKHGARVWVNTLWNSLCAGYSDEKAVENADANWGYLIRRGANMIQTDNPAELMQYLEVNGLRDF